MSTKTSKAKEVARLQLEAAALLGEPKKVDVVAAVVAHDCDVSLHTALVFSRATLLAYCECRVIAGRVTVSMPDSVALPLRKRMSSEAIAKGAGLVYRALTQGVFSLSNVNAA